jgi:hypothetical protein
MRLSTSLTAGTLVAKLELPAAVEAALWALIGEYWERGEEIEFEADVDDDEAYDALDQRGKLPEPPTIDEMLDGDELVEAVKPLLDGDIPTAIILFGRLLGTDTDPQRRLEQMLYARRRKAEAPATAAALAA